MAGRPPSIRTRWVTHCAGVSASCSPSVSASGRGAQAAGPLASPVCGANVATSAASASFRRPLGTAEGLSFIANTDSSGAVLQPHCDYRINGSVPPTRYWTLTLVTSRGYLIDNPARRFGFTSSEIMRTADGAFDITVARQARPGNWLPLGDAQPFVLMFRLYDTLLDFGTAKLDASAMPRILKGRCE